MKEIAIVYLMAGISSRFNGKIKQLARVGPNSETLLECSLSQSLPAGFSKIIFIVGPKTYDAIKEIFGDSYKGVPIQYAFQDFDTTKRDRPWGTTDAVTTIKNLVTTSFVVCNGDDLYGEQAFKLLFNHLQNNENCATVGYKLKNVVPKHGSVNRGIFQVENNFVKSVKENFNVTLDNFREKDLSEESLCNMNLFALTPEALEMLDDIVIKFKEKNKEDRKIECLLPEDIGELINEQKIKVKIYPTDETWIGITNPDDEEHVKELLKNFKFG